MAWYSDEQWEYMQDCKDKSITARSARKTRSHCGKGGKVKLPSDYMTKKELKSMNGECKSYRLNSPMSWEEFKSMPDDLKVVYVKALREKYNVPNNALAEMFGVSGPVVSRYFDKLGLGVGKAAASSKKYWNKEAFLAWRNGVKIEDVKVEEEEPEVEEDNTPEVVVEETDFPENEEEQAVDEILDLCAKLVEDRSEEIRDIEPAGPIISTNYHLPVIPMKGTITFHNNFADEALETMKCILSNARVSLTISWECAFEDEEVSR